MAGKWTLDFQFVEDQFVAYPVPPDGNYRPGAMRVFPADNIHEAHEFVDKLNEQLEQRDAAVEWYVEEWDMPDDYYVSTVYVVIPPYLEDGHLIDEYGIREFTDKGLAEKFVQIQNKKLKEE